MYVAGTAGQLPGTACYVMYNNAPQALPRGEYFAGNARRLSLKKRGQRTGRSRATGDDHHIHANTGASGTLQLAVMANTAAVLYSQHPYSYS